MKRGVPEILDFFLIGKNNRTHNCQNIYQIGKSFEYFSKALKLVLPLELRIPFMGISPTVVTKVSLSGLLMPGA